MSAITFVAADTPFTDSGNTAWVLAAAALVLFMTPGLALFYGGMVRTKSVLNMMMMSFITMGTVGTVWVLWQYFTYGRLAEHARTEAAMQRDEEMPNKKLTPFPAVR